MIATALNFIFAPTQPSVRPSGTSTDAWQGLSFVVVRWFII